MEWAVTGITTDHGNPHGERFWNVFCAVYGSMELNLAIEKTSRTRSRMQVVYSVDRNKRAGKNSCQISIGARLPMRSAQGAPRNVQSKFERASRILPRLMKLLGIYGSSPYVTYVW